MTNRKKRRMPCQIQVGDRWHSGLVLDLSPSGLFIQTLAKVREQQRIEISVAGDAGEPMALVVEVVRRKVVPPRLLAYAQGGVGVRIVSAPEEYYRLLSRLGIPDGPPAPDADAEGAEAALVFAREPGDLPRFRLRLGQTNGPRSLRVEVSALDAEAARACALEEAGLGWKVLDVEPL